LFSFIIQRHKSPHVTIQSGDAEKNTAKVKAMTREVEEIGETLDEWCEITKCPPISKAALRQGVGGFPSCEFALSCSSFMIEFLLSICGRVWRRKNNGIWERKDRYMRECASQNSLIYCTPPLSSCVLPLSSSCLPSGPPPSLPPSLPPSSSSPSLLPPYFDRCLPACLASSE